VFGLWGFGLANVSGKFVKLHELKMDKDAIIDFSHFGSFS